jgi:LysR family transcriptional regulator, hypochlorite-specific transcription factor HypT
MNTAWFEDFLVLAATQNFSRAAQERHVTQPAFGRRIRSLEEWLGVSLFDRSTQPVQLTTAGKWFESVARATLQRISHLPREAQDVVASQSATLKLAATHALSFTFVPTWLRRVESHLALGPIQLVSDVLPRCDHLLDQREVHFAISHAIANAVHDGKDIQTQYLTIGSDALIAVSGVNTRGQVIYSLEAKQDADVPLQRGLWFGSNPACKFEPQAIACTAQAGDDCTLGFRASKHGLGRTRCRVVAAEPDCARLRSGTPQTVRPNRMGYSTGR